MRNAKNSRIVPGFYLSSVIMKATGHLLAWESVAPAKVRRWSMESDGRYAIEVILVHDGEIKVRYIDDERYLMSEIEEMIDELGGTFSTLGDGEEHEDA